MVLFDVENPRKTSSCSLELLPESWELPGSSQECLTICTAAATAVPFTKVHLTEASEAFVVSSRSHRQEESADLN